jgi:hypothetical protein
MEELSERAWSLASAFEEVERDAVLHLVNDDRAVSGIPLITDASLMDDALAERRAHFKAALRSALDRLPSRDLVIVLTRLVEGSPATTNGSVSLRLLDDVVDMYEVEAHKFLNAEADNVATLVGSIRRGLTGSQPRALVERLLARLEEVVENWVFVARPVQLGASHRGRDHDISLRMGFEIRSLAIDLYNKHHLLQDAQRLTELLQKRFGSVPALVEFTNKDAATLNDLRAKAGEKGNDSAGGDKELNYRGVIRGIFNEPLEISAAGIDWKGRRWPLESITRVRWGGKRRIENGVQKFAFTITFGTDSQLAFVSTENQQFFDQVTQNLWRGVCVRLLLDMLERVRAGERVSFGNIRVSDLGVELPTHLGGGRRDEEEFVPWYELSIMPKDGLFHLLKKGDDSVFGVLSFESDDNTHVLSCALERFWKNSNSRLSSLLDD